MAVLELRLAMIVPTWSKPEGWEGGGGGGGGGEVLSHFT